VLGVRLHGREVATERRTGEATEVVPAAAADHGADAVVVAEGVAGLDDLRAALDAPVTAVADPAAGA